MQSYAHLSPQPAQQRARRPQRTHAPATNGAAQPYRQHAPTKRHHQPRRPLVPLLLLLCSALLLSACSGLLDGLLPRASHSPSQGQSSASTEAPPVFGAKRWEQRLERSLYGLAPRLAPTLPEDSQLDLSEASLLAAEHGRLRVAFEDQVDLLSPLGRRDVKSFIELWQPTRQSGEMTLLPAFKADRDSILALLDDEGPLLCFTARSQELVLIDNDRAWRLAVDSKLRTSLFDSLKPQADKAAYIHANPKLYDESFLGMLKRNPSAAPFIFDYPRLKEMQPMNTATADDSRRQPVDFLQWDDRWGSAEYCGAPLALTGCGPTSVAIIARSFYPEETRFNPLDIAELATSEGYAVNGTGTAWHFFDQGLGTLGLKGQQIPATEAAVKAALDRGSMLIFSMGPGDFTLVGHIIVVYGEEKDGLLVQDPYSIERSAKHWPFAQIAPQIMGIWEISKAK